MTSGVWCELALVGANVHPSVRITVDGGRFAAIDIGVAPRPADRRLDGITIPGLANAHSHAFHRALRSRTHQDGGTFWTWRERMYRAAERLDPDSYLRLARATYGEMVLAGITTVGEFHYLHHTPDGSRYADHNEMGRALLAAAAGAGLRITLLDTLYLHGGATGAESSPPSRVQRRFADHDADAWSERVDDLVGSVEPERHRIGAAIHSVRAVDPISMRVAATWARHHDVALHAHVSEQVAENEQCVAVHGATPVRVLRDAGVLDARFTAVHATHLDTGDIELLSGSTVCVCPTTERDLGDGIGPTIELAAAGAALALGSDSHAVIDLFEEARALELDERLRSQRRGCHAVEQLLAAATSAGHRSLGWDDAGSIEVGRRADLVTVSSASVRMAGVDHASAAAAVVYAATASDVTDVMIDGRVVVDEGRHAEIDVATELAASIAIVMGD